MLMSAITLMGMLFTMFVGGISIIRILRSWNKRRERVDAMRRCVCGYSLEHLDVPRCPECGRLAGFKDTRPEDLGITEEELRTFAEAKRKARDSSHAENNLR